MLLVATLFRAATLFAKRDAVRVGVVLGVNNGTNEEGVGRALTSDQEQWCANEGELLSTALLDSAPAGRHCSALIDTPRILPLHFLLRLAIYTHPCWHKPKVM